MEVTKEGRFRPVLSKWREAIRDLSRDLLMLQATGDYDGAQAFLERYGKVTPAMAEAIGRLSDIPVDVDPVFVSAGKGN